MSKVFVHGNPETDAIWSDLVGELTDRGVDGIVLLSPPGFGSPSPDGWGATRSEYRDWLVRELESVVETSGGPVDVIGHDWGAGHVFGLLSVRPELVRSWACDCTGLIHPDYVWHDMAQLWQTPDLGEQVVASMRAGTREERIAMMASLGMADDAAADVADSIDSIATCILPLYRTGAQPVMAQLGEALAAADLPPGLAVDPSEDPYVGPPGRAAEMADRLSARHAPLEGAGHWWMCERPGESAETLLEFWNSLSR